MKISRTAGIALLAAALSIGAAAAQAIKGEEIGRAHV